MWTTTGWRPVGCGLGVVESGARRGRDARSGSDTKCPV
ncbi:hypothetical protein RAJCM14343_5421 [Rhodococcus aetherivorans]|uniref:Uncharacterized protein n=1 Tax=Rhodococcus aetherivorans TaxID=191292 RepID=A0ABQ0YUE7_9NOCA|nr:hypothetical protein RAJCM14343_5421 [Rhodococcus aetherivorans]